MKRDQEAHFAWGRAVCDILGLDPHTVLAGSVSIHPGSVTWTAVDPATGNRAARSADTTTEQEAAIDALPSPWHPAPPKPEHRWVETTVMEDSSYHYQCTGCGATHTIPRDACREESA